MKGSFTQEGFQALEYGLDDRLLSAAFGGSVGLLAGSIPTILVQIGVAYLFRNWKFIKPAGLFTLLACMATGHILALPILLNL